MTRERKSGSRQEGRQVSRFQLGDPLVRSEDNWLKPECWVAPLMVGGVAGSLFSIFVANLFLFLGLVAWLVHALRTGRHQLLFPPFSRILAVLLLLIVFAVALSPEPFVSVWYLKKMLKFFAVLLIYTYMDRRWVERGLSALFLIAGGSALLGLLQYFWLRDVHLMNRIDGFMSHWMTFSGQLMLVSLVLTAFGIFLWRDRGEECSSISPWTLALLPLLLLAVSLTFTRGAWLGLFFGLLALAVLRSFKWSLFLTISVLVILFLSPSQFQERLISSFDLTDTTTRGRLELLKTGYQLIAEHPWTGVGPRRLPAAAIEMRSRGEYPEELYQHLHNNILQVGAELGLPVLFVWLFLWIRMAYDLIRFWWDRRRSPWVGFLSPAALSVLVAFHVMGLFEYNFGDSEIAILLLFLLTVPYAAARREGMPRAQPLKSFWPRRVDPAVDGGRV